jgi:DNA-binding transcriptional LysR family regulator
MRNLRKQLPPLTSLVVFEAVARQLSFTRAALELNITQAAVSRQIRSLEENLGVALFTRLHRTIQLTPAGKKLLRTVTISLEYLADTVGELRTGSGTGAGYITVVATLAVASFWLLPRLAKFRAAFADIEVRVLATDQEIEQISEPFDAGIRYGAGYWPGMSARFLGQAEIFPVCSPDYLRRQPFADIDGLLEQTLLYQEDSRWDWIDWPIWLAELDIGGGSSNIRQSLKINSYSLLIQAAVAGQGVALGWSHLIDQLLADGSLVRPIDATLRTRHGFYLVTPAGRMTSAPAEAFCDWVAAEFAS